MTIQELAAAMTIVSLAVATLFAHYVSRLPYAPECPACKAVTADVQNKRLADRLCAVLAGSSVRRCLRCGWSGRMRWRWAVREVRRDGRG